VLFGGWYSSLTLETGVWAMVEGVNLILSRYFLFDLRFQKNAAMETKMIIAKALTPAPTPAWTAIGRPVEVDLTG